MASAAAITISNTGGATADLSQVIAGTSTALAAGGTISIFDNGGTVPVGTASIGADGTWSTSVLLTHGANSIVAEALAGDTVEAISNTVSYDLESVLSTPSNASSPASPAPAPASKVVSSHGPHSVFTFGPAAGQVLLTDFHLSGPGHDIVTLPPAFTSIAQALHGLHDQGGDAVLSLGSRGTITFDGITTAELRSHPHDFRLHP